MKIGVEARTLEGARHGVARYLANLLSEMVELEGPNEYLLYSRMPLAPEGLPADPRVTYRVIRAKPSILWRHARLPREMKRDGCDLHYSPSYFVPLIKVCPNVVVVHDITFKVHPEWFAKDRRFLFDDIFWRKVAGSEAIITVSEHSKRDVVEILGVAPEKVRVIYEAADPAFRPVEDTALLAGVREKYGLAEEFILHVGALHTRRNIPRLLQAAARAEVELDRNLDILFVGSQASFSPIVDIPALAREAGLRGRTGQAEYITDGDLLLLYNAASMLAYPSLYEGFGLPALEAMACGTVVACSNVTSLPEVAGEAALYFDPLDVDSISEALVRGLRDTALRAHLREAGIKRAAGFSWKRAAGETLAVFQEVAG